MGQEVAARTRFQERERATNRQADATSSQWCDGPWGFLLCKLGTWKAERDAARALEGPRRALLEAEKVVRELEGRLSQQDLAKSVELLEGKFALDQAKTAVAAADDRVRDREEQLDEARAEERRKNFWETCKKHVPNALLLASALLLGPYGLRAVKYYTIAAIAERRPALRIPPPRFWKAEDLAGKDTYVRFGKPQAELPVEVRVGEVLRLRTGYLSSWRGKPSPDTELVFGGWRHFLISLVARLTLLTRFKPSLGSEEELPGSEAPVAAVVGNPEDPDSIIMRLDLANHPGFVLHPQCVVGILSHVLDSNNKIGGLMIRTKWKLGWHALATMQFRYILFYGTGSLFIEGLGALYHEKAGGAGTAQDRVVGFDSRLGYKTRRLRPFGAYLVGRAPLIEDSFEGEDGYQFLRQKTSSAALREGLVGRTVDYVLSGVGKILGF